MGGESIDMTRRAPLLAAGLAAVAVAAAAAALWARTGAGAVAAAVAAAFALAGAAAVAWSHLVHTTEPDVEPRHEGGPSSPHRRMLLRFGLGTAAVAAVGVSVPAARRIQRSVDELKRTRWSPGSLVVDGDGEPVRIDEVREGGIVTVYPDGAVGAVDSQAVLIRERPERFSSTPDDLVIDGVVIHSKLCTHMACSLGLYEQDRGSLLCPCHQAVFDVLDGGRPVSGPARRPLPRLPFRRRDDGLLEATGDFDDTVGAGFWWRP